jgi:hypothetical protein
MDTYRRLCLFLFTIILISCSKQQPKVVTRAYYFWRMSDDPKPNEVNFLKQNGVQKLYVHLLDVDWSEVYGAVPVTSRRAESLFYNMRNYDSFNVQYIPVIFITNKTMERIDSSDIPLLAKRIVRRCLPSYDVEDMKYEERHKPYWEKIEALHPKEIQIDCDWTCPTAGRYFFLLKEVKRLLPSDSIKISATVRLHQFKYPKKTGVPPVDRGMLMVYNLSDPKQYGTGNSIFEFKKAKAYFDGVKEYPLPLDIALPAWNWCIIYRDKKFYQVENELNEETLKELSFVKPKNNHMYTVMQDTVYKDLFLRPGDEIKAEAISEEELSQATNLAKKAVNSDSLTVSLFELSENEFQRYSHESIDKVYASFH